MATWRIVILLALAASPSRATAETPPPVPTPSAPTPAAAGPGASAADEARRALEAVGPRRLAPWDGRLVAPPSRWAAILERARDDPRIRGLLLGMDAEVEATLRCDPRSYRRAISIDGILPSMRDSSIGRAGRNGLTYALAMSDCAQADFLREHGVQLAIAAAYLQRQDMIDRCVEILREVAKWRPLQRPGWTLYEDGRRMPPGGDGVFLATSWGVGGIVDMLTVLGDRVPADLRDRLRGLLREEVATIARDWADRRPWYVSGRAVASNQWAEPNVALVRACLFLGDEGLRDAYELGAENLAATLAASGQDGAFLEGVGYAQMTMGSVCDAVAEMQRAGDARLASMPFMRGFWRWFLHMHMPGRRLVNCFDSKVSELPAWAITTPLGALVSAAIASGDPEALPALRSMFPEGNSTPAGIAYAAAISGVRAGPPASSIPAFAHFPSERVVAWRSRFEPPSARQTAMGVWVRGGSTDERNHAHRDQGHVSVYAGDRVVLMECGSPDYADPDYDPKYAEAAGHSIMQLGEVRPRGTPVDAPLTVRRLDAQGGAVEVDSTRAYLSAARCVRIVEWDSAGKVAIDDSVELRSAADAGAEWYRFHLGASEAVTIAGSGREWSVAWPGCRMRITASLPVSVEQCEWPDRTARPYRHRALRVRSPGAETRLELRTELAVELDPAG